MAQILILSFLIYAQRLKALGALPRNLLGLWRYLLFFKAKNSIEAEI
jgi:hypothetical protein